MKKLVFYFLFALFLGIFVFAGYRLYAKYTEYQQMEKSYSDIAELVVQTVAPTESTSSIPETEKPTEPTQMQVTELSSEPTETTEAIEEERRYDIPVPISVDFEKLHEINTDIVGWLYCEGTSINYPVLRGETNKTYLRHQYDGKYNYAGSIFMDYRCDPNLADPYTMIFGHNMTTNTMFHALDSFRRQSFLEKHSRFFYLTPSGENFCLEVICSNLTKYKDDLRLFELRDDTRNFELIRSKAFADSGIEVTEEDKLVLLATCAYDYKNARCTLLCKVLPLME